MNKKQDIFDTVLRNVFQQGGPSVNERGLCTYRGENGRKCAAGHLIPDRAYAPSMEGKSADHPMVLPFMEIGLVSPKLIVACQKAHDHATYRSLDDDDNFLMKFKGLMQDVAKNFGLQFKEELTREGQGTAEPSAAAPASDIDADQAPA